MDRFDWIDMETWPRREIYKLYTEEWTTVTYSFTKKFSVAKLVPYLKERGIKLVPALMWLVCREVNRVENFRLAIRDGSLGRWDVVHPLFPTLNETENMTFHSLRYEEDFQTFYRAYLAEQEENRGKTNLWATGRPENFFMVSIFPFLHFDGLSLQLKNAKGYFAPYIAIGRYNSEMELPCMIMVNHAAVDGWHVAGFLNSLEAALAQPDRYFGQR